MKKGLSKSFKRFVIAFEVIFFLLISAALYNFFLPLGNGKKTIYFSKSDIPSIIQDLRHNGYNITDWDKYLLGTLPLPSPGWYDISHTDGGRYHFFKHLKDTPSQTMKIKIYAGETRNEIIARLSNDLKLDKNKLHKIYSERSRFQEADLFANTYIIARKADENTTMQYLFDRSEEILDRFEKENFSNNLDHNTLKVLLTIASIIQKESNDPKEMPLIASVIYNRLKKGMKLQMDGTLNYGEYSHTIVTPERIKNDTTFYNTYKYKGLPPAPLAAVSIQSLKAAMYPEESSYLFFMLHKDGGHVFSSTYKEHLASLRAFRAYQKNKQKKRKKTAKKNQKQKDHAHIKEKKEKKKETIKK